MNWFILATLAPLLWAICNHIDKIVLEKYFKDGGVGTLLIFSALAALIAAPVFYFIDPSVLAGVGRDNFLIIIVAAVLDIVLLWAYLNALQRDDSSNVVLFYQLVPIFGIVSGWLFLGEVISSNQLVAMMVVIFGTSIISFEDDGGKLKFKTGTIAFMFLACVCWAAELAIFKVVAIEENVWRTLFWKHIVLAILGVVMFLFIPKYRVSFIEAYRANSVPIFGATLLTEVLYMFGTASYGVAAMSAPVALVLLTETFQSIFVFLIAIFLVRFAPRFATETVERKHLFRKVLAICVTGAGTYFLLVS